MPVTVDFQLKMGFGGFFCARDFFLGCKYLKATLGVLGFTALPRKFHSDSSAKHFRVEKRLSLKTGPRLVPYTALVTTVGFMRVGTLDQTYCHRGEHPV